MYSFTESDPAIFGDDFLIESKACYQYLDKPVYFLLSRRGKALEIHVKAVGRKGLLRLREAAGAIVKEIPEAFPWCKMLLAPVKKMSVYNLCRNIGFKDAGLVDFPPDKARLMVIDYG